MSVDSLSRTGGHAIFFFMGSFNSLDISSNGRVTKKGDLNMPRSALYDPCGIGAPPIAWFPKVV